MVDFNKVLQQKTQYQSRTYDEGQRTFMLKVYNLMAIAIAITGATAFFASQIPALMQAIHGSFLGIVVMFAPLGILFYIQLKGQNMSTAKIQAWFWAFSFIFGLSLSYIFLAYTGVSIVRTLFITSASFGALSLYGYTTKKDLSAMGSFLIMGLFGIILASIVNMFMASSGLAFAINILGVLIFAGLTAHDTQNIKNMYYAVGANAQTAGRYAVFGALTLYLDFLNLFMFLLQFIGDRK